MGENSFNNTVEYLFKGMDNFITTKTVIGDAVRFEDGTIVLPLVDVLEWLPGLLPMILRRKIMVEVVWVERSSQVPCLSSKMETPNW